METARDRDRLARPWLGGRAIMRRALVWLAILFFAGAISPTLAPVVADVEPVQVQLQVRVAEVNQTALRDLGLPFSLPSGILGSQPVEGVTTQEGFGFKPIDSDSFLQSGQALGLGGLTRGPDLTDSILNVLRDNDLLQLLAEPNLITVSKEEATFLAGGDLTVPQQGAGQNDIEFKDFGIRLKVTPNITPDLRIILDLNIESDKLDVAAEPPRVDTRRASTSVQLRDGQSFAIAGLIDEETRQAVDKVPMLGDLPVLGALFRSAKHRKKETELLIFVTPRLFDEDGNPISYGGGGVASDAGKERIACPQPPADSALIVGANSDVGSGAQLKARVKETIGGLFGSALGGLLGGRPGGGGGDDFDEPQTVADPVPGEKLRSCNDPATGTTIKVGGKVDKNGLLISSHIEEAPGDGTFQSVFVENSDGQRAGPTDYLVYEMYSEWALMVSWTRDEWVDGQHVDHQEGGWDESGSNFLGTFKVPVENEGIWKKLGFNNAVKGIQGLGARFPITKEQLQSGPVNVVVHVTRPDEDPVITTPFIFLVSLTPDEELNIEQVDRTLAQMACR